MPIHPTEKSKKIGYFTEKAAFKAAGWFYFYIFLNCILWLIKIIERNNNNKGIM